MNVLVFAKTIALCSVAFGSCIRGAIREGSGLHFSALTQANGALGRTGSPALRGTHGDGSDQTQLLQLLRSHRGLTPQDRPVEPPVPVRDLEMEAPPENPRNGAT